MSSEVVRLISGSEKLVLDACDGQGTIAEAIGVFLYIDPNFKKWGTDVAGEATPEIPVAVYEMAEDANFAKMFTSLNSDVSKIVLTQDQILNFTQKHRGWLQTKSLATFFLFRAAGKLLVASANVKSFGGLRMSAYRFENVDIWDAVLQRRLVVPQL